LKELSKAEEMVLLAVWRLNGNAYGVTIRRQIFYDTDKDYTYGTLYGLLRQLTSKGLVKKRAGAPVPEKGGRGKTFFDLTKTGKEALKEALQLHKQLWKDLSELSFR